MRKSIQLAMHPQLTRLQPYVLTNSYSKRASKQQVLTVFLFMLLLTLHQLFITTTTIHINHPLLYILLSFRYVLLIIMIYDYYVLTFGDPVDLIVLEGQKNQDNVICVLVLYLNHPSIVILVRGVRRILIIIVGFLIINFIRLLFIYLAFSFISIAMAAWVLAFQFTSKQIVIFQFQKWIVVAYIFITIVTALFVIGLIGFHLYLCCINIKTINYIYKDDMNKRPINKQKMTYKINVQPPLSAEVIRPFARNQFNPQSSYNGGLQQINKMAYYRK